jgi:hypothetical protein
MRITNGRQAHLGVENPCFSDTLHQQAWRKDNSVKIDFNLREILEKQFGKITPGKVIAGLLVLWVVVRALGFVLSLFDAVFPFVVLGLIAYFGYQVLQSRNPELIDQIINRKSTKQPEVIEGKGKVIDLATAQAPRKTATKAPAVQQAEAALESAARLVDPIEAAAAEEVEAAVEPRNMKVAQKINPTTGLPEPDLERLEANEQEAAQQPTNADLIRQQLENRKKRLRGE